MTALFPDGTSVTARALLLGERLDLKRFEAAERLATNPVVIPCGPGHIVALFRYGAAVIFAAGAIDERRVLEQVSPLVSQPYPMRESEDIRLRLQAGADDQVGGAEIVLREATVERLQVVADVLAKSAVLAYYEETLAGVFDAIEPFASGLRQGGGRIPRGRDLLRYVADTLLIEQKMVGRVEVGEKPEVVWEQPDLGRLFAALEDEFELSERRLALERKLDLISRTVTTLVDLLQDRRSLRVEYYIVALIVIEIVLTVYSMVRGSP
jgi:required for meiotic nuclear division protein 1